MKSTKKSQVIRLKNNMLVVNNIEYDHQGNILLENDDCSILKK